jgi:putative membrane-bound dehydrogenase-like protein
MTSARSSWPCFLCLLVLPASGRAAEPASALRHRVPDGFVIEQVAGEKQVRFPMFAAFDDRGRLFVAESSGLDLYAEISAATRKCRIRLLEDKDGDGRFETSRVFADKLVFPMGLVWRAGRLYVADPPDLVALEDTDGDGRADKRTVILTGFGHRDNGSLHGLTFGPDGWLYMTLGHPDGYKLRKGSGFLEGRSGALIRCRPDGSDPEVVSRGFENLVEVAFTPRGDIIGTDNWFRNVNAKGSGGLRDALVHLLDGGLYPTHPDKGSPLPLTGDTLGPVSLFPAVALSGLTRYRGTLFPAEMRGNLFAAQHNARKVTRHVLISDTSTFRSRDLDLVSSDDPDFHPSDVLEDADGSLLVLDTGSWYIHHCPTGKIRKSPAVGGIYRVRPRKAAPVADPRGLKENWSRASPEQLCERLGDRRPAVRDRASVELSARGKAVIAALARLLTGSVSTAVKQRAVWALAVIPDEQSLVPLRKTLEATEPEVVATAARALGRRADRKAAQSLEQLLSSRSPFIALAAAEALCRCGDLGNLPALWTALAANPDRFLEHALIHAAHHLADTRALKTALGNRHPRVQKAALLLLDQPPRPRGLLRPEEVLVRAAATDPGLRRAALDVLQRHPEWAREAAGKIRGWLRKKDLSSEESATLRGSLLAFQSRGAVQELMAGALTGSQGNVPARQRLLVLETLADVSLPVLPSSWVKGLEHVLDRGPAELRAQAVRTAAVLQLPQLDERLAALAGDVKQPEELRLEALRAVIARRPRLSTGLFDCVIGQFGEKTSPLASLRAAEILGRSELSDAQVRVLLRRVRGNPLVSPALLLRALPKAVSEETAGALLDYLTGAIQGGWHPPEKSLGPVLQKLPPAVAGRSKVIELLREKTKGQRQMLAALEPLLEGGEPQRGRGVFFSNKVACASCHRVGAEGGMVGPDLTRVGAVRAGRDLLESVVLPSSTFAQGYETVQVTTIAGRVLTGIMARNTAEVLVIRDSSGAEVRVPRGKIESVTRQPTSLMPEGLTQSMTREELRDLLAFLRSLK